MMVPSPYVIFCAEAHAGIQVKAIPEDRMKVMRRMGTSLWVGRRSILVMPDIRGANLEEMCELLHSPAGSLAPSFAHQRPHAGQTTT